MNNEEVINKRKRICICFFGVIGRSIRFTYESILKNLIEPLKKDNDVHVYVFNLDVERTVVDGRSVNQMNYKIIKADYCEQHKQSILDKELDVYYQEGICKMRHDYTNIAIRNAIRQMYSEYRVGMYLEKHKDEFDCAVVCGPDYYLLRPVNINDVKNCMIDTSIVYTTNVNDGNGITNGYYIGSIDPMIKILKRYEDIRDLLPTKRDYEYLLKKTFVKYEVSRRLTDMLFVKVRNNQSIVRQGKMRYASFRKLINQIKLVSITDPNKKIIPIITPDVEQKKDLNEDVEPPKVESNISIENTKPDIPLNKPEDPVNKPEDPVNIEDIKEIDIYDDFYLDDSSCRETRGCVLMPSNRTKVNREVSLKPNVNQRNNQRNNSINNQYVERKIPKTPEAQFPPQPVIQPLQSSNRVKRKQNPKPVAPIKQNSIRSQLRLMKVTKL